MENKTIQLEAGEVVMRKPTAGARNKAMIKAETADGIKQTLMMVELLPMCVASHPWGITPVKVALDNLSVVEYDKLIDGLRQMLEPKVDLKKK
ncbi:MAG: hypothetical protein Unbinned1693contig1002_46 [Prokaryotic dsDNA virus sp.]|jgi:hypothetical protein|nr:MAG: hypothetical protein Unbinned1693contig1002_46 [Prokaryotic dsDNA virus sp.]|tara:strand:+ start:1719 stop:1997 length:279 start_codon:yes stop_codon:yes gene_type:complete